MKHYNSTGIRNSVLQTLFKDSDPNMISRILDWYTKGGAGEITDALNHAASPDKITPTDLGSIQKARILDSALQKVDPDIRYRGQLYRGIGVPSAPWNLRDTLQAKPGDFLVSDVPTSFTQNYSAAADTFANPSVYPQRAVIRVPQSSQGTTIGPLSSFNLNNEREVLVPSMTGYQVKGTQPMPRGGVLMHTKEIPNFDIGAARLGSGRVFMRGLKSLPALQVGSMLPEILNYYLSSPEARARMEQDARQELLNSIGGGSDA